MDKTTFECAGNKKATGDIPAAYLSIAIPDHPGRQSKSYIRQPEAGATEGLLDCDSGVELINSGSNDVTELLQHQQQAHQHNQFELGYKP